ncbi:MAG: class I mannose-6-phosphate isomerase [Prevotellaceae bacterium]|nr:class I mannose-6-phosphate isomerase [Prevotellaceae bacterium]
MTRPYSFKPLLKPTIWGGTLLSQLKNAASEAQNVGESWEVSGLEGRESVVAGGGIDAEGDRGLRLSQLVERHGARLVGEETWRRHGAHFPLLAKFIDARSDLSIQVHPDDKTAKARYGGTGKDEMWYIVRAREGARMVAGLRKSLSPDEFVRFINSLTAGDNGRLYEVVNREESRVGDVFYMPAGSVHAIGAGNLLAEIQQASDVTYRIYDFHRLDGNGKQRELHVELAKDAIDYTVRTDYKRPYDRLSDNAELVSAPPFSVRRISVEGARRVDLARDSFVIAMCVGGLCTVNGTRISEGNSLLVPACDNLLRLDGRGILLTATV